MPGSPRQTLFPQAHLVVVCRARPQPRNGICQPLRGHRSRIQSQQYSRLPVDPPLFAAGISECNRFGDCFQNSGKPPQLFVEFPAGPLVCEQRPQQRPSRVDGFFEVRGEPSRRSPEQEQSRAAGSVAHQRQDDDGPRTPAPERGIEFGELSVVLPCSIVTARESGSDRARAADAPEYVVAAPTVTAS